MTAKQFYTAVLVECNNTNAPSLLLEDFNYFVNKVVNMYINKRYAIYDTMQQTTDDLRVLKSQAKISNVKKISDIFSNDSWELYLPSDYLHLLNCICLFETTEKQGCEEKGTINRYEAKRLTADSWGTIMNDYYNRPSAKQPYYYIHNVNTSTVIPTNPIKTDTSLGTGTDPYLTIPRMDQPVTKINLASTIQTNGNTISTVDRESGYRYGNASSIRMEIRCGEDANLKGVVVDYLKVPQHILLTQDQLDSVSDNSQIMEFPDYVCQEMINELVTLFMASVADPRIQTVPLVSQSIVDPTRQQTTTKS